MKTQFQPLTKFVKRLEFLEAEVKKGHKQLAQLHRYLKKFKSAVEKDRSLQEAIADSGSVPTVEDSSK